MSKIKYLASANGLADDWRMNSRDRSSANPPPPYKVADAGGWGLADTESWPEEGVSGITVVYVSRH